MSACAAAVMSGASLVPVMVMVTVWSSEAASSVDRDGVGQRQCSRRRRDSRTPLGGGERPVQVPLAAPAGLIDDGGEQRSSGGLVEARPAVVPVATATVTVTVWPVSDTSTSVTVSVPATASRRIGSLVERLGGLGQRVAGAAAVMSGASLVPVMVMVTVWSSEVAPHRRPRRCRSASRLSPSSR